jgi:hypothetical protein
MKLTRRPLRLTASLACLFFPMLWWGLQGGTGLLFWLVVVPVTLGVGAGVLIAQLDRP